MIDKVDVRISEFASPGPALLQLMRRLKEDYIVPPFRTGKYYQYSADLSDTGVDAIVHLNCRYGRHTHKVEILQAGQKTIWEMADILRALFDVDPMPLELMRVDLTADVEDAPVSWFRDNAYVSRKRYSSRIEKSREHEMQFIGMSSGTVETIYAGKRPVLIRIYNKFGELHVKYQRLRQDCERFNARMEGMDLTPEDRYYGTRIPPTFEEFCLEQGFVYREGGILTRVESQIGGTKRLPHGLKTFGDLRHVHKIEPFNGMRIVALAPVQNVDAPPEGVSVRNWMAAIGYEELVRVKGLQGARAIVLKFGQGNGARILESLAESAPATRPPVTIQEIQHLFRESTLKQTQERGRYTGDVSHTFDESQPAILAPDLCIAIAHGHLHV